MCERPVIIDLEKDSYLSSYLRIMKLIPPDRESLFLFLEF